MLLGQWVLNDLIHFPGGGIGFLFAGLGTWWFFKPVKANFVSPVSVQGWIQRCKEVLEEFEEYEEEAKLLGIENLGINVLEEIIDRSEPQSLAVVSSLGVPLPDRKTLQSALQCPEKLNILWAKPLPIKEDFWKWPDFLNQQDSLLYVLSLPLRAVDLLWLAQVPEDQPAWLIVMTLDSSDLDEQMKALKAQLPDRWKNLLVRWIAEEKAMIEPLAPMRKLLQNPVGNIDTTRQRLLSGLHSSWQVDLERLRRHRFYKVQQRTQWIVAGAVVACPVPTTDLLAVAVVNGLMIQEMSQIWKCSWRPETLQAVAKCLAGAAVAQGVVEWSGQTLIGVAKLDGSSWLAAGALQAISAAYLTRVVGRSMADWLALNSGVEEPDLDALKSQASLLVANAAEQERTDWAAFLKQARKWLLENEISSAKSISLPQA